MEVLTWNLFHGRAVPDEPRSLYERFAATLASWPWDVALLQEVPPWWATPLGHDCRASARSALTSRNALPWLRRALAQRRPDLMKSNGGGANVILVRGMRVLEHRSTTLRRWPERRVAHSVRLADGTWVTNLHAQVHSPARAGADIAAAAAATLAWAGAAPAVLGGDFNVAHPSAEGFVHAGGHGVDHVFARGLSAPVAPRVPARGSLSDHAPVLVSLR